MKTPELSVLEAQKEIQHFSERMQRMFGMVRELLTLSSSETNKKDNKAGDFNKLYTRIEKYEGISDNMELEIAKYLDSVSDAHLSDDTKAKIRAMLRWSLLAMLASTWLAPSLASITPRPIILLKSSTNISTR